MKKIKIWPLMAAVFAGGDSVELAGAGAMLDIRTSKFTWTLTNSTAPTVVTHVAGGRVVMTNAMADSLAGWTEADRYRALQLRLYILLYIVSRAQEW